MLSQHLRDRFFQRYFVELTPEILRELLAAAISTPGQQDTQDPQREHVRVAWRGQWVRLVWNRRRRFVYTFLPPLSPDYRSRPTSPQQPHDRRPET